VYSDTLNSHQCRLLADRKKGTDMTLQGFSELSFDRIIQAAEDSLGVPFSGYIFQLPSYVNRVYELQTEDEVRYIVKFYRPGRWSREALEEEHTFLHDCEEMEIPVISPLKLTNGKTLAETSSIYFAVFPKRSGRAADSESDEMFQRLGSLLGRIHTAGAKRKANKRIQCHPTHSTARFVRHLLDGGFVAPASADAFKEVTGEILRRITPLFDQAEMIRIHGDCHRGNILERKGEGLHIIDFDDMMTGPPVQDFWMLLPDHVHKAQREIDLILTGYEQFRPFDRSTLRLIEPLRAMRMMYFIAWCSTQVDDLQFRNNFPDWGSESFWQQEIHDLRELLELMGELDIC